MAFPRTSITDLKLQASPNLGRALKRAPLAEKGFEAGVPATPEHLGDDEKRVWDRVVALLSARGTLTEADGFAIERYATLYVRWRNELRELDAEGTVIETVRALGKDHLGVHARVANPRLKIVQATERQLLALEMELGLTPRHRGEPGKTRKELNVNDLLTFGSAS